MSVEMLTLKSREEWLKVRAGRIGGSEISSVVGLNPWRTNVELWELKTGRRTSEDISDSPFVKYGTEAEKHLRNLFALDYPQYEVGYVDNNLWLNDKYPFAHASLDGWLTDGDGRNGILEIKTSNIVNPAQKAKWENRIPDNYYCQVCWYMAVCEAEFAVLKAQLKWDNGKDVFLMTRHYHMEREDMQEDIDFLLAKGSEFWEYCKNGTEPPLVLPDI